MTSDVAARLEMAIPSPFALRAEVEALCREAREGGYRAVCVPSGRVADACDFAGESNIKVSCLVGLPYGSPDPDAKRYETEVAVDFGAHEIELMPSLGHLKERNYKYVLREIRDVVEAADERPVKVLVEVPLWEPDELQEILQMVLDSGAHYVATGHFQLPSVPQIQTLRELLGPKFGIKASGLVDLATAGAYLNAGADLIGTAPFTQSVAGQQAFGI